MNTEQQRALKLARGSYQRDLVLGTKTLGGSTLRGRARRYSGQYNASANHLVERLREHGIQFRIQYGPRGGLRSSKIVFD